MRNLRAMTTSRPRALTSTAVLVLATLLASVAVVEGQEPTTLPVYDLETPDHVLQARVYEEEFPAGTAFPWSGLPEVAASAEQPEAVRLAARYLVRVMAGQDNDLPELFWMETTSPRAISNVAKILRAVLGRLGDPSRVDFLHTWFYDDFRMVVVEVFGSSGKSRVVALGMVEQDGELLRSDDWGRALPVMDLFSYMARNRNQGLLQGREPTGFPLSLTFPAERYPVVVQFDGTVHPPELQEGGTVPPAVGFARLVFEVASQGTNAEFIQLWTEERREELAELPASALGRLTGLRERLSPGGPVRHLLTVDLDRFRVHYYRTEGSQEVRFLILEEVDGELRLSEDLYTNIENLMVSDLTLEQVPALAEGASQ